VTVEPDGDGSRWLGARRVDPRSAIPLYAQLRDILQAEIEALPLGERLPSEPEITRAYGVSRATVRHAISELEHAGMIARRRGAGTFVADRRNHAWQIQSERGWYDEMTRRGYEVRTDTLHRGLEVPPLWVSEALGTGREVPVIRLDRLRSVNGEIATFVCNYLHPRSCAPVLEADLERASLYAWLEEHCGISLAEGTRTIRAAAADEVLAGHFQIPAGSPLLLVDAVSIDASVGPFEVYRCWHRADLTSIVVNVTP
jgi:GntR family transcriptional regulator